MSLMLQILFQNVLDRLHTTRLLSFDASDRIRYETTGNRRGHLTEIWTLAIHPLTQHYDFVFLQYDAIFKKHF